MSENPIDIASSTGRLRRLQLLSLRAERDGNGSLAAQCIAMAAREQSAQPAGGGNQEAFAMPVLTPDEARRELEEFLVEYEASRERGKDEGRTTVEAHAAEAPAPGRSR